MGNLFTVDQKHEHVLLLLLRRPNMLKSKLPIFFLYSCEELNQELELLYYVDRTDNEIYIFILLEIK